MTAQTANKVTVPVGSDGWNLTEHIKGAFESARLIILVANQTERDGLAALFPLGVLPNPTFVSRSDLNSRLQRWNGTRWGQTSNTELGRTSTGVGGTLAATPSWSDLLIVTATSLGGEVIIDYDVALTNANSGAHRDAAVRVTCDGNEVHGWSFKAPLVSGIDAPVFPSRQVTHTPAAGSHTWKVQGNASIAGAVQIINGSMSVTEKP